MKYFLFAFLVISITFSYGQTTTYQFKKVVRKGYINYCLINGHDTIKFSKGAIALKGDKQFATIDGNRYQFQHEKDRPWKFMISDTLLGTSRNRNFFEVKTVAGAAYDFSDSLSRENYRWKYTVGGEDVITGRFYKSGGDKFVEITVLNSDIENFEFIKMMTLFKGAFEHHHSSNAKTWLIISAVALCVRVATL